MIANSPVLAFYDPNKELALENYASEYGLGSALMQDGKPVVFASRALSSAERNYAQIDKEVLAVLFRLQRFHHYTYGRLTHVITDDKPLVTIVQKPLSIEPRRLQAMLLMTQEYTLTYKTVQQIPVAGALSRAPASEPLVTELITVNSRYHPSSPIALTRAERRP